MGVATQVLDKGNTQELSSDCTECGGNDGRDIAIGGKHGKPVAFLKVLRWSASLESVPASKKERPTAYPIFDGTNVIGRSNESNICFPFTAISSRHACIDVKQTLHTVRDCISTNQTRRNGVSLEPEVRYELVDGVRLTFADIECSYHIASSLPGEKIDNFNEIVSTAKSSQSSALASHNSSALSVTPSSLAATFLQNFIDDENIDDQLNQETSSKTSEDDDSKAPVFVAPSHAANIHNERPATVLTVLAEESQSITDDDQRLSVSLFGESGKETQSVVGETEGFLADERIETDEYDKMNSEEPKAADDNLGAGDRAEEIESVDHTSNIDIVAASGKTTAGEASTRMASGEAKDGEKNGDDKLHERSGPSTDGSGMADAAETDTIPYVNELPRLNSLTVDSRLSAFLENSTHASAGETPNSEQNGTDRQFGVSRTTTIWSAPTSDGRTTRKRGKKSLLDVAVDGWLFNSEPALRRKASRGGGGANRRRAATDYPKNYFDELIDKCNKFPLSSKRASKEKTVEDKRESTDEKLGGSTTAKDPYEITPSQFDVSAGSFRASVKRATEKTAASSKKAPKARKSMNLTKCEETAAPFFARTVGSISSLAVGQGQRLDHGEPAERPQQARDVSTGEDSASKTVQNCSSVDLLVTDEPRPKKTKVGTISADARTQHEQEKDIIIKDAKQESAKSSESGDESALVIDEGAALTKNSRKKPAAAKRQLRQKKVKAENDTLVEMSNPRQELAPDETEVKPKRGRPKAATKDGVAKKAASSKLPTSKKDPSKKTAELVKVCFTQMGNISKAKAESLTDAVTSLGGEVVDAGADCSHLIVPKFARSAKFMCAVARGVPIVTPAWVEASKRAGRFLDSDEFVVEDKTEETRFGFRLRECLSDARRAIENGDGGLFDGYTMYSTESVRPNREEMKSIIIAAGGQFVCRLPKLAAPDKQRFVVISCEEDAKSADVKRATAAQILIVSMEFVFTGLLKREIDVEKYRLFQNFPPSKDESKVKVPSASSVDDGGASSQPTKRKKAKGK